MPLAGPPMTKTFDMTRLLEVGLSTRPDEDVLISAATTWTWRELDRDSDRLAAHYIAMGLRPGDRVASLMPNRNALLVHYLACFKARLAATPLNYRYMTPEIDHALGESEASILLAHAERDEDVAASTEAAKLSLGVISFGGEDGRATNFEGLLKEAPPAVDLPVPEPSDPVIVFFTSGSTGKPKAVTHTRETYAAVLASAIESHEITANDVVLPGSSISHSGGMLYSLMAMTVGARVVMPRTFDADELLPLLREHRPTLMWMLPSALITLVRDHGASHEDFSSVRLCTSGGDKVSAELEKEFTELVGFPIDELWGLSEIGCATINPPSGVNKLGSVGPLGPGYEGSVRDEDGRELGVGEAGRLWIRSPANMIGYWNRPDANAESFRDGWLDTGDVMRADEDGYLWFEGRKKQIIVHDGSNICPQEVEEAVMAHPAVEHAGVVGVHDAVHGENVWAYVTLREGAGTPVVQEVIQCAREQVGYKAPEAIIFLEDMPLNATGKVDRVTLKKMAADQLGAHHP
ncbi:MAG: acyl--CoA ligase [Alphaproteobacteria bacterium]|nr:acyl--CoA ligase [Alphaproteobacteria bacterium]